MCRRPAEDRGERADAVLSPERAVRGRSRRWRTASGREPVGYFRPHRSEDRPFAVRRPGPENEEVRNGSFPPFRTSLWIAAGGRRPPACSGGSRGRANETESGRCERQRPDSVSFLWICPSVRNFLSAGRKNVRRPFPFFGIFSGAGRKRYFAGDQQQRWLFGVTTTNL